MADQFFNYHSYFFTKKFGKHNIYFNEDFLRIRGAWIWESRNCFQNEAFPFVIKDFGVSELLKELIQETNVPWLHCMDNSRKWSKNARVCGQFFVLVEDCKLAISDWQNISDIILFCMEMLGDL